MADNIDPIIDRDDLVRLGKRTPEGRIIREVPKSEIPPEFVRVSVDGLSLYMEFTEAAEEVLNRVPSEPIHPPFPQAVLDTLLPIVEGHALIDPEPESVGDWENRLRRYPTPWRDLAETELQIDALKRFTADMRGDDDASIRRRLDIHTVILLRNALGESYRVAGYNSVTSERAGEIIDWMSSYESLLRVRDRTRDLRALMAPSSPAPPRTTLHGLIAEDGKLNDHAPFDVQEALDTAPLVVALDIDSGLPRALLLDYPRDEKEPPGLSRADLLFPGEFPLQYARRDFTFPPGTLEVEVDDDVEALKLLQIACALKAAMCPSPWYGAIGNLKPCALTLDLPVSGPPQHPPFPDLVRTFLVQLAPLYTGELDQITVALENGLLRTAAPWEQLSLLEQIAEAVHYFGESAPADETPADRYAVARDRITRTATEARERMEGVGSVSAERARAMGWWLHRTGPAQRRVIRTAVLRGLMADRLRGPERITFDELLGSDTPFDPLELLMSAQDVVFVEVHSQHELLLDSDWCPKVNGPIDPTRDRTLRVESTVDNVGRLCRVLKWFRWSLRAQ